MKVAVIGAGLSGLVAIKYLKSSAFDVTCFEQSDQIGGTWVYKETTGKDKNGVPVHSAMYKNLKTILPTQLMEFFDYKWEDSEVRNKFY